MAGIFDPHSDEVLSDESNPTILDVIEERLSRREFLKTAVSASALVLGATALTNTETAAAQQSQAFGFTAIKGSPIETDDVRVPEGYFARTLLRWGDPITPTAPAFDPFNQTREAQEQQVGYNCDFVGFLPLPYGSGSSDRGLLVVNHEYTNPELMFPNYQNINPLRQWVDVEIAAHGVSVVEIQRNAAGGWDVVRDSQYNRRYTGFSPMNISGPAAGADWMKTKYDPTGTFVLGTLNNCAAGITPWGTVVTAEENFNQYFAYSGGLPSSDPRRAVHTRLGLPTGQSSRKWEQHHGRFDVTQEPNEAFRFGWMVELDPFNPGMTPVKRTWLGRFKHEACTFVVAPDGRAVGYTGDDERFEYVYKFISSRTVNPNDRAANMNLLDDGMLYVARFNPDGTGQWLPLQFGTGPLTPANGWTSQADVLIRSRIAADALGATRMDRPEDIETNPVNKKIYMIMTSNNQRGASGRPAPDAANPRADNRTGHVLEVTEANNDYAATTFTWSIFMLAGDPADPSTFFAGFPKDKVSKIGNPDNMTFDRQGNLWIATDGQEDSLKETDGLFGVPVEGPFRGQVQQFFASVAGSEVCGPEFTPDNTTLFLAIQHPGEGGTFEKPRSQWPDKAGMARPSVITVQAFDGRPIGTFGPAPATAAPGTEIPAALPNTGGTDVPLWVAGAGVAAAAAGAILSRRTRKDANGAEQDEQAS